MTKRKIETNTFEYSFKELQNILEKLETEIDDCSLEEVLKNYQRGLELIKICKEKLSEAELKIYKLSKDS